MVESNHDAALARWPKDPEGALDAHNAYYWHDLNAAWHRAIRNNVSHFNIVEEGMRRAALADDVDFVNSGGSYLVGDVEYGLHGDLGVGASRGSPNQYRRFGPKRSSGHTHTPKIVEGVYIAGVSANLNQGYNKGPTTWAHAHIVQYDNGKRAIIMSEDGRYEPAGEAVEYKGGSIAAFACSCGPFEPTQLLSTLPNSEERSVHDKRYQVFISSTFTDLQEERRAVQDAVISMGDFPVQMESFPATDEAQMDFIGPLIKQSDYYVLIIGGRYGTIDETGLSFTHQEFRYAVEKGVPVLVLVHGKPDAIVVGKTESTDAGRAKLAEFIKEAGYKRIRKDWQNIGELKLAVHEALDHAKRSKPRPGWVRGDSIASIDALEELNEVRKENEKFREALGNLSVDIPLPKLPDAGELTTLTLLPLTSNKGTKRGSSAKIQGSWISFFPLFFSNLDVSTNDWNGDFYFNIDHDDSCVKIASAIAGELAPVDTNGCFRITRSTLDRLISYYTEAGLMIASGNEGQTPFTETAQRLARRHHVVGSASPFTIIEGEVTVTTIGSTGGNFARDLGDDIPF